MKYNMSSIMKRAWEVKKNNIARVGKQLTAYNRSGFMTFGECLSQAWTEAKRELAKASRAIAQAAAAVTKKVMVYVVPNWLMHEKECFGIFSNIVTPDKIQRETRKAFMYHETWFPKSMCEIEFR